MEHSTSESHCRYRRSSWKQFLQLNDNVTFSNQVHVERDNARLNTSPSPPKSGVFSEGILQYAMGQELVSRRTKQRSQGQPPLFILRYLDK